MDRRGFFDHRQDKWHGAVDMSLRLLDKLRMLPEGQIRHALLRFCLDSCRITHLMRCTPFAAYETSADRVTSALRLAVTDLVGRSLTPMAWEQATLPIAQQGLGIKAPADVWPGARVAALGGFHAGGALSVGCPSGLLGCLAPDVPDVLSALSAVSGPACDPLDR